MHLDVKFLSKMLGRYAENYYFCGVLFNYYTQTV